MRFSLIGKLWVIGLLPLSCLADSGVVSKPAVSDSALFRSPDDYFHIRPENHPETVTVSGTCRRIWQDQKDIWTSPLLLHKKDLQWLVPLGGLTGVLIGTDHHTMTLIHSNASNRSLSSNISNASVAAFAATAAVSYGVGAITRSEHARETGILTTEALADSFFVSEALKFVSQRDHPDVAHNNLNGQFWQQVSLNSSFPSEHAALAWSAAAVFAREYPGPLTQWTAYGLASL